MSAYRRIAVRAYSERPNAKKKKSRGQKGGWPRGLLFFDTETRTDQSQRLTFGSWRYARALPSGGLRVVEEGLFYADDLSGEEQRVLAEYAANHRAGVGRGGDPELKLYSLEEFLKRVLYKAAFGAGAAIVGFNLPFDLSRLAWRWTGGAKGYQNGISLLLWSYLDRDGERCESGYRPRVDIKTIDSKRHLMRFAGTLAGEDGEKADEPGPLLDLRTLVFALTDRSHSLASACEAFGVESGKAEATRHGEVTPEYIAYNRQDVAATVGLYEKTFAEYAALDIDLPPDGAYSPATIGRAQLRAMGIRPVLERQPDFPKSVLGNAMVAYYGGRSECRVRRVPVPVVPVDFLSMYATVNSLMGLWSLVVAERVEVVDATEVVRSFLADASVEACLDPSIWKEFVGLAYLVPDGEDILPVRAPYADGSDSYQIGVNQLRCDEGLWYAIPDAMASALLAGKPPRLERAVRFVPRGVSPDLRETSLRGALSIDPASEDFFRAVVEERKRLSAAGEAGAERQRLDRFLKVLASSTTYGIYAQMDRHELGGTRTEEVALYGLDEHPFSSRVRAPEQPGEFAFPPLAACITAGARLMLALLERMIGEAGGTYACADTDGMAIVASREGGLIPCSGGPYRTAAGEEAIRALSFAEVEGLRDRFRPLNPYGADAVPGSILELEKENFGPDGERRQVYCFAVSAKRYALYVVEDGEPVIVKPSQHALGYLLNPIDPSAEDRDWIEELWQREVRRAHGLSTDDPDWFPQPALGRLTAAKPATLEGFAALNERRPYAEQIKPYNFMLVAQTAPFGHPSGVEPQRFQAIAPWSNDPSEQDLPWIDKATGKPVQITTDGPTGGPGVARVKTFGELARAYGVHPEPKSLGPDGTPCGRGTIGLLSRRLVIATRIVHIGKESNELEELEAGSVHDSGEVQLQFVSPRWDPWERLVRPTLRMFGARVVAERSRMSLSAVKDQLAGRSRPHPANMGKLGRVAGSLAREALAKSGVPAPRDAVDSCAAFLRHRNEPLVADSAGAVVLQG